jgi:hypothetical protein
VITTEQEIAIRDTLTNMPKLAVGLGTAEQACSIAAINLAMTGTLTDTVPDCMSRVIGRWIIRIQDPMPATIRDSAAWRELLVLSAGTGREHEAERVALVLDWMWDALALVQPRADVRGYRVAWATMLRERTAQSARSASAYAATTADAYAAASASESAAAYAYADAASSAATAAAASSSASTATAAAAAAAASASASASAHAASSTATAADAYADAAPSAYAAAAAWETIDPVGLLRRLVAVTDARAKAVQP